MRDSARLRIAIAVVLRAALAAAPFPLTGCPAGQPVVDARAAETPRASPPGTGVRTTVEVRYYEVAGRSELVLASGSPAAGFRMSNTANGQGSRLELDSVTGVFPEPHLSILGGVGSVGVNIGVPLYRLHVYDEISVPQSASPPSQAKTSQRVWRTAPTAIPTKIAR